MVDSVHKHTDKIYNDGNVSIGPPDPEEIRSATKSTDVEPQVEKWLARALHRNVAQVANLCEDVYYFSIYREKELVGQIFLHDIDRQSGEALIGYHMFEAHYRGAGIGTKALAMLQTFVVECTDLTRLVIITSSDNIASQKIAQKCGFVHVGSAREDPNKVVFRWDIRRWNN